MMLEYCDWERWLTIENDDLYRRIENDDREWLLNMTEIIINDDDGWRVDMALGSQQHEQGKAVFLGNLDFKTSEDDIR
jgi:hypothetical protein